MELTMPQQQALMDAHVATNGVTYLPLTTRRQTAQSLARRGLVTEGVFGYWKLTSEGLGLGAKMKESVRQAKVRGR